MMNCNCCSPPYLMSHDDLCIKYHELVLGICHVLAEVNASLGFLLIQRLNSWEISHLAIRIQKRGQGTTVNDLQTGVFRSLVILQRHSTRSSNRSDTDQRQNYSSIPPATSFSFPLLYTWIQTSAVQHLHTHQYCLLIPADDTINRHDFALSD